MNSSLLSPARRIFRRASNLSRKLTDQSPVRPVVLIQSDDWGRVGAPSPEAIKKMQDAGYAAGESPWDYYGLETKEDLDALGELLQSHKDADGRNAVISAVFVMANADLERMRAEGYGEFRSISIKEGFPSPWQQTSLAENYRQLINKGLFYPALHGYTHFNPDILLDIAREDSERGGRVRALHECGIPYLASLTPEFNFALLDRSGHHEKFIERNAQSRWINEGLRIFQEVFGVLPVSTCAPGYRFNAESCALWKEAGIQVVHVSGGILGRHDGVWLVPRNVHFEPVLNENALDSALLAADRAVRKGEPIIISSHSINYITRHLHKADVGRAALSGLLKGLCKRYPNLRFANEVELFESWCRRDAAWWRLPSMEEVRERFR